MKQSKSDPSRRNDSDAAEIVFSIDEDGDESGAERAIIADITRDDAWIAAPAADAPRLSEWR